MLLNVEERMALIKMLPSRGSFVVIKMVKGLHEKLILTEGEVKSFQFVHEPTKNVYTWNDAGRDKPVEIKINDIEKGIIKETLVSLDKEQGLIFDLICVYERFMQSGS